MCVRLVKPNCDSNDCDDRPPYHIIVIRSRILCDSFDCELQKNLQFAIIRISQSKPDLQYVDFHTFSSAVLIPSESSHDKNFQSIVHVSREINQLQYILKVNQEYHVTCDVTHQSTITYKYGIFSIRNMKTSKSFLDEIMKLSDQTHGSCQSRHYQSHKISLRTLASSPGSLREEKGPGNEAIRACS